MPRDSIKFVFFGTSPFAATVLTELLAHGLQPTVIVTQPDAPHGRKKIITPPPVKVWAEIHGILCIQPQTLKKMQEHEKDLIAAPSDVWIVADYGKLIPESLLQIPTHGGLNIHVSLLPHYRGASPMQYAILDGVPETGVSIMQMVAKLDEGDIVAQERFDLRSWHPTYPELAQHTAVVGTKLLIASLPGYLNGEIVPTKQDHTKATYTKLFTDADGFVDPAVILGTAATETVEAAERRVRALNPSPGTWTKLQTRHNKELRLKIKSAHVEHGKLVPIIVVPEGRREMSWEEFKRGYL